MMFIFSMMGLCSYMVLYYNLKKRFEDNKRKIVGFHEMKTISKFYKW